MFVLTNKKKTKKASIFDCILTFFGIKKTQKHVPSFEETLTSYLDSNGKQILSNEEIVDLIKNCQKSGISGEPIENYKEKIIAVLNNPEEVKSLSKWECRPAGVWRAIQDPLNSTVEANPGLF